MLPATAEFQALQNQKPKNFDMIKNTINSLQNHHRFWLLTAFLFIQALVLAITCSSPFSIFTNTHKVVSNFSTPNPKKDASTNSDCLQGRVYVYDLPSMFNKELVLTDCEDLHPWKWQCGIVNTNYGYGKEEAAELTGILPGNLNLGWYRTNQFSLELIFHYRILNHKCRTPDPEAATAFYVPFYASLAMGPYLLINDTEKRDWHCKMMLNWMNNQTYWRKNNGSDHFLTLGRITWDFRRLTDPKKLWGSSFLNMPEMERVRRFTIETAPGFDDDISIPYPSGFHPNSKSQLQQWQNFVRERRRASLFTFVGAAREKTDFRSLLLSYCYNESDSCRVVDCALTLCNNGSSASLEAFLSSHFCLQPKGDSYTRKAVFDCMVAGTIPVFFWKLTAYDQYQWFMPGEPKSYSVFIDQEEVRNGKSIRKILEGYSEEDVRKMREKVIETIPNIVYTKPLEEGLSESERFTDAFDIAVDGVMEKIREENENAAVQEMETELN
ncbi:hypothetical protein M9H77_05721 [Catharanthus roseus]|uniref:Uncharacterized protein n=1 Tax=Catharanthus roseus TaxID=4058 RepID=A0ACC0CI64_CATRO|nr:hypothetical protein M9H77_05721 [Catharanthus roseus]